MKKTIEKALIVGLAVLSLAFYLKTSVGEIGSTQFDDAYMITRYAKHYLGGNGFSWNPVDGPAYGITSPAYLMLITAILGLTGCSDATALTFTSFAAGLLAVFTLVLLGFFVQDGKWTRKSWMPMLIMPCILLVPPFRYHSLTGMETTLSLLANSLLLCAIVIATRRRTNSAMFLCLLAGCLSYSTRPDNGLYAMLLPPLFFIAIDRCLWRYAVRYTLFFIVVVACSLVANRFLFGSFLPLPFFAKAGGFYHGFIGATKWNAMEGMLLFCSAALPFILVAVATVSRRTLLQLAAIASVLACTFAYLATVTQIMGPFSRYYYPSLSIAVLVAFVAVNGRAEESLRRSLPATVGLRLLGCVVALLLVLSTPLRNMAIVLWEKHMIGTTVAVVPATNYRMPQDRHLPQLGWWNSITAMSELLDCMPQGITLAASEYGFLGSRFPGLTIIDLVGLHDSTIANHGFSAAYVCSRRPDMIWFPTSDYSYIVATILDNPVFQQDYEYYQGAYDYGIALRKTSASYASMKDALKRECVRIYPGRNPVDYIAKPVAAPDKE